ncbi:MipA/OmpV family protein [Microbulbifer pacificus]|uniref:MipA/OmpV family protein n=1 Tax=Microbulbifer pacificus TaxID=407164 RepID=UPI000CF407DD|nr:MipA/OmpV family protein [Microbulbifer pacificus]
MHAFFARTAQTRRVASAFFWVMAVTGAVSAGAAETVDGYVKTGHWELALAVGRGVLQSPLSDRGDIDVHVMPAIRYYGERFYLEDTSVGFSLYETPNFALDIAGRLNTDGLFFPGSGSELTEGLALTGKLLGVDEPVETDMAPPKRRVSYLGGFSARWLGPLDISLGMYRDVTGVHGGDEIPLVLGKRFSIGRFGFGVELGATYQNRKLVDYYYGAETGADMLGNTRANILLYRAGDALNTHATLEAKYYLSTSVNLVLAGRMDWLDDTIVASPFVVQHKPIAFFAGVQYSLK